jgi:hypothetical protein
MLTGQKPDQQTTYKPALNMCFDIEWQGHIAVAESQLGSLVQRIKFSTKIPLHLKAQARYAQCDRNTQVNQRTTINKELISNII